MELTLKTSLDIELMSHKENFEITRNSDTCYNYDVIKCKLRGIKKEVVIEHEETQDESRTRWSCGLIHHELDGKVEGSNLAAANFLFDQISSRKSEQKKKRSLSLIALEQ